MSQINKTIRFSLAVYVIHFLISHVVLPILGRSDIFPLYDWNLFSFTQSTGDYYYIAVEQLDKVSLSRPILTFQDLGELTAKDDYLLPHQIQRLGRLIDSEVENNNIISAKSEVESNLFQNRSFKYKLYKSKINYRDALLYKNIGLNSKLIYSSDEIFKVN